MQKIKLGKHIIKVVAKDDKQPKNSDPVITRYNLNIYAPEEVAELLDFCKLDDMEEDSYSLLEEIELNGKWYGIGLLQETRQDIYDMW